MTVKITAKKSKQTNKNSPKPVVHKRSAEYVILCLVLLAADWRLLASASSESVLDSSVTIITAGWPFGALFNVWDKIATENIHQERQEGTRTVIIQWAVFPHVFPLSLYFLASVPPSCTHTLFLLLWHSMFEENFKSKLGSMDFGSK